MVDPITAVAAATKAWAGVQAFIEAGKSIEDTFSVVARWQGHASDVLYASQRQEKKPTHLKSWCFLAQSKLRRRRCSRHASVLRTSEKS